MRRTLIAGILLMAVFPAAAGALPPRPPSAGKTRIAIGHLKIAPRLSMEGYSRNRFPHRISQGEGCDTRKRVLIRDGRNVRVGSGCRIISGTWRSYYDGLIVTSASRVDIDTSCRSPTRGGPAPSGGRTNGGATSQTVSKTPSSSR